MNDRVDVKGCVYHDHWSEGRFEAGPVHHGQHREEQHAQNEPRQRHRRHPQGEKGGACGQLNIFI